MQAVYCTCNDSNSLMFFISQYSHSIFIKYSHLLINTLSLLISYTEGHLMVTCIVHKANQIRDILYAWCFGCLFCNTGYEPYRRSPTLTVGPNIRLISTFVHCVWRWPAIEATLAQGLVFVLKWLHIICQSLSPNHTRPLALVIPLFISTGTFSTPPIMRLCCRVADV